MNNLINNLKELFKIRFLRNVLLVAVAGTLSIPLIEGFVIYPLFAKYLISITEDDARRTARHLAGDLNVMSGPLTKGAIPDSFIAGGETLLESFGLRKLKIFSSDGETLFSTEEKDVGVINKKDYFHREVINGNLFTLMVRKETRTAEDEIFTADVVETYVPLINDDGTVVGAFEIYFDITERWSALKSLMFWSVLGMIVAIGAILTALSYALIRAARITVERQQEQIKLQLAADVMANAEEGIMVTDADHRIESVNRAFVEITGYTEQEVLGKPPEFLDSGRHGEAFFAAMWRTVREQGSWQGEIWNRRKDGDIYPEWLTISAIRGEKGEVVKYVGMFLDISHFKVKESKLESLAYRDALTGLPNRHLVMDRLEQNLAVAKRENIKSVVMFLDLDGFKAVNDNFGHSVGDSLLQEVARRFRSCLREEDTLGRLGGDEFLIGIRQISHLQEVELIAERLISSLGKTSLNIEGHECSVSVSVGISCHPEHGSEAGTLVRCADLAMYAVKSSGKNGYRFYHPEMQEPVNTNPMDLAG